MIIKNGIYNKSLTKKSSRLEQRLANFDFWVLVISFFKILKYSSPYIPAANFSVIHIVLYKIPVKCNFNYNPQFNILDICYFSYRKLILM